MNFSHINTTATVSKATYDVCVFLLLVLSCLVLLFEDGGGFLLRCCWGGGGGGGHRLTEKEPLFCYLCIFMHCVVILYAVKRQMYMLILYSL